ncbi:MAG: Asp-tRNA(Asn)/Glu-tRNA(Gln) amidotransferase subunit GatB [Firmicutes bacterium]|nr:Asp-tRNA(Asn)/Glu-tRNA(Gln) amidotransferase subunit GatB [Bacillota bacterium]
MKKSGIEAGYEVVMGLEVHVELATQTKIFCGCEVAFGAPPNTQVCPVCLGMPGSLPVLNEKVVELALKAALALGCEISEISHQDRKNYFYPDLPKAYQISQNDAPIGKNGRLAIETADGERMIGITRLHIEEDAGKLIHDSSKGTLIDYNRGGVPLIEIVSEPDFRTAEEVKAYLLKLKSTLQYLGVSSCKMNEGAFRCDVNLSVRKVGDPQMGTRTEMKNLNSIAFIVKAIESEALRQIKLLESGDQVVQETRRWDPVKGISTAMRSKENAHDYRYFPDPDLATILLSHEMVNAAKATLPLLPDDYKRLFVLNDGIRPDVAEVLVSDKGLADYYRACAEQTAYKTVLANLLVTEVLRMADKAGDDETVIAIRPEAMVSLVALIGEERINLGIAKRVLSALWESDKRPVQIIDENDWWPLKDLASLEALAEMILKETPQILVDYHNGKTQAFGAFMGQMMKRSQGKADPALSESLFHEIAKRRL